MLEINLLCEFVYMDIVQKILNSTNKGYKKYPLFAGFIKM